MTKLGELCLAGSLTAQSKVNAYRWFSRAADRGYAPALKARNELRPHLSVDEIAAAPARKTTAAAEPSKSSRHEGRNVFVTGTTH
jgi:TPR repeat protein